MARSSGVSKTSIEQIVKRARLPHRSTLELIINRYDPDRLAVWIEAWQRVQAGDCRRRQREPTSARSPGTLPFGTPTFRGRHREIQTLRAALLRRAGPGTLTNIVIDGMAGVGKTALAIEVANGVSTEFPDRCHFVDMHGYSDSAPATSPHEAMRQVLRGLDPTDTDIPAQPDERARLYRDRLSRSDALVVLDNARSPEQVAQLLVGPGRSRVIVTSRRQFPSLQDTVPMTVECLSTDDATDLLRAAIAIDRHAGHDESLTRLVELCGGLPLALRILAARLARRRTWTVASLTDRLADEHRRLAEVSDGERSISATFQLSYDDLDERQRKMFRLLGTAPGTDIDPERAAGLSDTSVSEAGGLLEELLDCNLLSQQTVDRYRMHDLVGTYAAHQAQIDPVEQRAALARVVAWTVERATRHADDFLTTVPDSCSGQPSSSQNWFLVEHENLVATVLAAASSHAHQAVVDLSQAMSLPLLVTGQSEDLRRIAAQWTNSARMLDDRRAEGNARLAAAQATVRLGDRATGLEECRLALAAFLEANETAGQGAALKELGNIYWYSNEYQEALRYYTRALPLHRATTDRAGEATTLSNIGAVHWQLGDSRSALEHYEQALGIRREVGDIVGIAQSLNNIGLTHERQGNLRAALAALEEALTLSVATLNRPQQCSTVTNIGNVYRQLGRFEDGEREFSTAITLARQLREPVLEAEAQNCLGDLLYTAGRDQDAMTSYSTALDLSAAGVDRFEEAHAQEGMAGVHARRGRRDEALASVRRSVELYRILGVASDLARAEETLRRLAEDD